jgi:hypothetical protein
MGGEHLLDLEIVHTTLLEALGELLDRRDPKAQPHECLRLVDPLTDLRQMQTSRDPLAVLVGGAVDDHGPSVPGGSVPPGLRAVTAAPVAIPIPLPAGSYRRAS